MSDKEDYFVDTVEDFFTKQEGKKHPIRKMGKFMLRGFIFDVLSAIGVVTSTLSVCNDSQFQTVVVLCCLMLSMLIGELFLIVTTCLPCIILVKRPLRRKIIFTIFKIFSAVISMGILLCTSLSMDKEEWTNVLIQGWLAFILMLGNVYTILVNIYELMIFYIRNKWDKHIDLVI